jgi:CRISPR/Cas system CSM-associated protein Csm2 small subunit
MWETLVQFWNNNSANIAVSLLVGFVFFVLGPMGLWFSGKKIRRERIRKAKETLIDLLEGMIVNQASIDEDKLRSVFRAVERDIDTDLSGEYHIDHWLGDVVLRFEKSRHLSAEQKQSYYDSVRKIIDEIHSKIDKKHVVEVPRKYEPIIDELKAALSIGETEKASRVLEELERALILRGRSQDPILNVFRVYRRMYERSPITFFIALIIGIGFYAYILSKFLPRLPF